MTTLMLMLMTIKIDADDGDDDDDDEGILHHAPSAASSDRQHWHGEPHYLGRCMQHL